MIGSSAALFSEFRHNGSLTSTVHHKFVLFIKSRFIILSELYGEVLGRVTRSDFQVDIGGKINYWIITLVISSYNKPNKYCKMDRRQSKRGRNIIKLTGFYSKYRVEAKRY